MTRPVDTVYGQLCRLTEYTMYIVHTSQRGLGDSGFRRYVLLPIYVGRYHALGLRLARVPSLAVETGTAEVGM